MALPDRLNATVVADPVLGFEDATPGMGQALEYSVLVDSPPSHSGNHRATIQHVVRMMSPSSK